MTNHNASENQIALRSKLVLARSWQSPGQCPSLKETASRSTSVIRRTSCWLSHSLVYRRHPANLLKRRNTSPGRFANFLWINLGAVRW
jgi:hypothetical protein